VTERFESYCEVLRSMTVEQRADRIDKLPLQPKGTNHHGRRIRVGLAAQPHEEDGTGGKRSIPAEPAHQHKELTMPFLQSA